MPGMVVIFNGKEEGKGKRGKEKNSQFLAAVRRRCAVVAKSVSTLVR